MLEKQHIGGETVTETGIFENKQHNKPTSPFAIFTRTLVLELGRFVI